MYVGFRSVRHMTVTLASAGFGLFFARFNEFRLDDKCSIIGHLGELGTFALIFFGG